MCVPCCMKRVCYWFSAERHAAMINTLDGFIFVRSWVSLSTRGQLSWLRFFVVSLKGIVQWSNIVSVRHDDFSFGYSIGSQTFTPCAPSRFCFNLRPPGKKHIKYYIWNINNLILLKRPSNNTYIFSNYTCVLCLFLVDKIVSHLLRPRGARPTLWEPLSYRNTYACMYIIEQI
jgi:hypothetical protein